jgi:hypothetical protein
MMSQALWPALAATAAKTLVCHRYIVGYKNIEELIEVMTQSRNILCRNLIY